VSMPTQFHSRIETTDDVQRVTLSGELDLSTCAELDGILDDLAGPASEIDLAGITFMDSSGMRCILNAKRRASEDERELRLVNPSSAVRRLFEVAGTESFLSHPSAEGAPDVVPNEAGIDDSGTGPVIGAAL
jgi:anti-anti-sigma factor